MIFPFAIIFAVLEPYTSAAISISPFCVVNKTVPLESAIDLLTSIFKAEFKVIPAPSISPLTIISPSWVTKSTLPLFALILLLISILFSESISTPSA